MLVDVLKLVQLFFGDLVPAVLGKRRLALVAVRSWHPESRRRTLGRRIFSLAGVFFHSWWRKLPRLTPFDVRAAHAPQRLSAGPSIRSISSPLASWVDRTLQREGLRTRLASVQRHVRRNEGRIE